LDQARCAGLAWPTMHPYHFGYSRFPWCLGLETASSCSYLYGQGSTQTNWLPSLPNAQLGDIYIQYLYGSCGSSQPLVDVSNVSSLYTIMPGQEGMPTLGRWALWDRAIHGTPNQTPIKGYHGGWANGTFPWTPGIDGIWTLSISSYGTLWRADALNNPPLVSNDAVLFAILAKKMRT